MQRSKQEQEAKNEFDATLELVLLGLADTDPATAIVLTGIVAYLRDIEEGLEALSNVFVAINRQAIEEVRDRLQSGAEKAAGLGHEAVKVGPNGYL